MTLTDIRVTGYASCADIEADFARVGILAKATVHAPNWVQVALPESIPSADRPEFEETVKSRCKIGTMVTYAYTVTTEEVESHKEKYEAGQALGFTTPPLGPYDCGCRGTVHTCGTVV